MLDAYISCAINWLIVVPGSGLNAVYNYYEEHHHCLYATREEEAVALATGLALGGERPLVLMQQSGVGNALNAVFSLADAYQVFFPIVVCDRSADDPNPVQRVSSTRTRLVLHNLDCAFIEWHEADAIDKFKSLLEARQRWILCSLIGEK